jgi:hypothetical protein
VPGEYHPPRNYRCRHEYEPEWFCWTGGSFTQLSQQIFSLLNGTFRIGNALVLQFHVLVTEHGEEIANTINTGLLLSQTCADIAFVRPVRDSAAGLIMLISGSRWVELRGGVIMLRMLFGIFSNSSIRFE